LIEAERGKLVRKLTHDGFWFVDIPRTSSTSIQYALGRVAGWPHGKSVVPELGHIGGVESFLLQSHVPAFIARELIGEDVWQRLNTFSVVRHPLDWAVSLWKYTQKYGDLGFEPDDFAHFLQQFSRKSAAALERRQVFPSNYMQSDYLVAPGLDELLVKTRLRFEDRTAIAEFLTSLCPEIELDQNFVATDARTYQATSEEQQLVRRIFARDFDLLDY
jgi:hypothetical protein